MTDTKNSFATPTAKPASIPMWQGVTDAMPVPDTSMLPPADAPALAGDEMLKRAVQGAHTTLDRLADGIAPTVHALGERIASGEDALQAKTEQVRQAREQWSESLRAAVRNNPLASVAGALAVGALIARLTR